MQKVSMASMFFVRLTWIMKIPWRKSPGGHFQKPKVKLMSRAFQFRVVNVDKELGSPIKASEEYTEKVVAFLAIAETLAANIAPYVVGYMVLNTASKIMIERAKR